MMKAILDILPPFWTKALEAPATWSFWEWIGYIASIIAIAAFIRAVLRQITRLSDRFLLPQITTWAVRANLWTIDTNSTALLDDVSEMLRWQNDPIRMTAFIARAAAMIMIYLTLGFLAIFTLPSVLKLTLGIPLLGLAFAGLIYIRKRMLLVIDLQEYVSKKVEKIGKFLTTAESFFEDETDVLERFDNIRSHLARINDLAKNIRAGGKSDCNHSNLIEAPDAES